MPKTYLYNGVEYPFSQETENPLILDSELAEPVNTKGLLFSPFSSVFLRAESLEWHADLEARVSMLPEFSSAVDKSYKKLIEDINSIDKIFENLSSTISSTIDQINNCFTCYKNLNDKMNFTQEDMDLLNSVSNVYALRTHIADFPKVNKILVAPSKIYDNLILSIKNLKSYIENIFLKVLPMLNFVLNGTEMDSSVSGQKERGRFRGKMQENDFAMMAELKARMESSDNLSPPHQKAAEIFNFLDKIGSIDLVALDKDINRLYEQHKKILAWFAQTREKARSLFFNFVLNFINKQGEIQPIYERMLQVLRENQKTDVLNWLQSNVEGRKKHLDDQKSLLGKRPSELPAEAITASPTKMPRISIASSNPATLFGATSPREGDFVSSGVTACP